MMRLDLAEGKIRATVKPLLGGRARWVIDFPRTAEYRSKILECLGQLAHTRFDGEVELRPRNETTSRLIVEFNNDENDFENRNLFLWAFTELLRS